MTDLPPDSMPVAKWEFMGLALMLIGIHGDDAEAYAQARLDEAMDGGPDQAGARVTWGEVVKLLPEARLYPRKRK